MNNNKQNTSQPDPKPSKPVFADPKPERVTASDNGGKKSNDNLNPAYKNINA